jgi:hypothetical protein
MHPLLTSSIPPIEKLPAGLIFDSNLSIIGGEGYCKTLMEGVFLMENILHADDITALRTIFQQAPKKEEVSALGLKKADEARYKGSERVSLWAPELAEQLYQLLLPFLAEREFNDFSRTDFWQEPASYRWKPIGISPLLRMMSYPIGSEHLPHYDAAYFYSDRKFRSLMSVIFYLSSHEKGGATRILQDGQDEIPEKERKHKDRNFPAGENEVLFKIQPKAGSVFLFDHRLFHDAEPCEEERILIRTDLVFEAI